MLEKLLPFIQYGHSIASIHELRILIITLKFVDKNAIRTWNFLNHPPYIGKLRFNREQMSDSIGDGLEFIKKRMDISIVIMINIIITLLQEPGTFDISSREIF